MRPGRQGKRAITVLDRYQAIRQHSLELIRPLSAEDCGVQSMADASPSKWHLAHTTWFFETVVLQCHVPDYEPYDPAFAFLFNSYYNSLGDRHARPARGLLTRPGLAEIKRYREHVDQAMFSLLREPDDAVLRLSEIGLQHEQQHQELLLTDIKHAFSCNPLLPAYQVAPPAAPPSTLVEARWKPFEAGVYPLGHTGPGFAYDNETPAHSVYLHDFAVSERLVSNADYAEFIQAGGYREPAHWLADGWDWCQAERLSAPLYWRGDSSAWQEFTLYGLQPLRPDAPVSHLSLYEADAYARWAGARLPSEAEWETAAPEPGLEHQGWFGQVWQWTSSAYQAYPGYRPPDGALAEYNAKFMCNQLVLRGSSALTPGGHARRTYRNFFYPQSRWQMTGLRLARDL